MSRFSTPDAWPTTVAQARAMQEQLRGRVVASDQLGGIERVAGVDVGFEDGGAIARAAVAVLEFPNLALCAQAIARAPVRFPYVPGYLSFREIPAVLAALAQLSPLPDVILCDGQGVAHPRRFGIASHLGVLIDVPTVGVGKSRLIGQYDPPPAEKGAWTPLHDGAEVIGAVLRTRASAKPLYISSGHRVGLATALDLVMRCTTRYRLPETTRAAHRLASGPLAPLPIE